MKMSRSNYAIDNDQTVTDNPKFTLSRDVENAYLADQCIRLALAVFGEAGEAKAIAEEILRGQRALPADRVPTPLTEDQKHARLLKMFRGALASPKTPEHLKAGLLRKYPELVS